MWRPRSRSWNHLVLVWCVWLLASRGVNSSSKQAATQVTQTHTHTTLTPTPTVSSPKQLTGRICCVDGKASSPTSVNNTCSDSTLSEDFSPLIYFDRSTHIPSDQVTTWTPEHLDCGEGFYLDYVYFNGTRDSVLFVRDNKIYLSYRDVYQKFTADFCMEKRDMGDYYTGVCRPNLSKVS